MLVFFMAPVQPAHAAFVVQVGGFADMRNAERAVRHLALSGYFAFVQTAQGEDGRPLMRVLVGPYDEKSQAQIARENLGQQGWGGFVRNHETTRLGTAVPDAARIDHAGDVTGPDLGAEAEQAQSDAQSTTLLGTQGEALAEASAPARGNREPGSLDELFAMEPHPGKALRPVRGSQEQPPPALMGFFQNELAYTYASPDHWSKFRNILQLGSAGRWSSKLRWRLTGRLSYDAIYDLDEYYPGEVRDDRQWEFMLRESYLDISAGDWDFRLGRQHIIWGEMVGLFFADVVSAKDMREFTLPDFDMLRIPQWAARAEYFKGNFHAEALWIPYMTYDDIGKPGYDYYPSLLQLPGFDLAIANEDQPAHRLDNSAYGLRLSYLKSGWDGSLFYYDSQDASPSFARQLSLVPVPTVTYTPEHNRIHQWGATLAKDFGPTVFKGEIVYNEGRRFGVTRFTDADGLVRQDYLDYIAGLEFSLPRESRFNLQFYQRRFHEHDSDIIPEDLESGFTLFLTTKALHPQLEAEALLIRSLNRSDWLFQPKLTWRFQNNWRLAAGADIFGGPSDAIFGQYDDKDRVYSELRYSF